MSPINHIVQNFFLPLKEHKKNALLTKITKLKMCGHRSLIFSTFEKNFRSFKTWSVTGCCLYLWMEEENITWFLKHTPSLYPAYELPVENSFKIQILPKPRPNLSEGGGVLKKLWCRVGGGFYKITWFIMWIGHHREFLKLTFRALALLRKLVCYVLVE